MKITPATTLVLQALAHDAGHGFDIIDKTSLPSGTVYPILRRLERERYASPTGTPSQPCRSIYG